MTGTLKRGARITGDARESYAAEIIQAYESGEAIRTIASRYGRSYGWVHRVLSENGIELRPRGSVRGESRGGRQRGRQRLSLEQRLEYQERLAARRR